jgi:hypothetical protein
VVYLVVLYIIQKHRQEPARQTDRQRDARYVAAVANLPLPLQLQLAGWQAGSCSCRRGAPFDHLVDLPIALRKMQVNHPSMGLRLRPAPLQQPLRQHIRPLRPQHAAHTPIASAGPFLAEANGGCELCSASLLVEWVERTELQTRHACSDSDSDRGSDSDRRATSIDQHGRHSKIQQDTRSQQQLAMQLLVKAHTAHSGTTVCLQADCI